MSLFAESVAIIQKILRYAKDGEILLRCECLKALSSILKGAGKGASDSLSKELFRIAKSGTSDKLPLIKRLSFEVQYAVYYFLVLPLYYVAHGSSLQSHCLYTSIITN